MSLLSEADGWQLWNVFNMLNLNQAESQTDLNLPRFYEAVAELSPELQGLVHGLFPELFVVYRQNQRGDQHG